MMLFFRTRGPRSSRSFELHYLSVSRQVNHLLMPLIVYEMCLQNAILITLAYKVKILFEKNNTPLWWAMEPWYVLMVEVPLQVGKKDRINNKCRLVILAPYITRNHEIYNGLEKSAGSSSFRTLTDV